MNSKDVLPEKDLLQKAAAMKIFDYLLLGKEFKGQTDITKKQNQGLGKNYEFDEEALNKKRPTFKKYSKSDPLYDANLGF